MEGHFESHKYGAPLILFGLPSQERGVVDYKIEIPKASSLILKHDLNAPLAGLDTIARENWPPVAIVFWAFRIMVGIGFLMLGLGLASLWLRWRGRLDEARWFHRWALLMGPSGFVAVLAGWTVTEVGRQPFTIYGLLRTIDSASPMAAPAVATSLIGFVIVYFAVYAAGADLSAAPHACAPAPRRGRPAQGRACTRSRHHARAGHIARAASDRRVQGSEVMGLTFDLPVIFAFIIAFAIFAYVVMDGFDLGIALLFPLMPAREDRDIMMNSVAPVWDGNETWLVLGGGRALRRLPARLRHPDAGDLHARDADVARARVPGRRLRIPLAGAPPLHLGRGLLRRVAGGSTLSGHCARCDPAGREGLGPRLWGGAGGTG